MPNVHQIPTNLLYVVALCNCELLKLDFEGWGSLDVSSIKSVLYTFLTSFNIKKIFSGIILVSGHLLRLLTYQHKNTTFLRWSRTYEVIIFAMYNTDKEKLRMCVRCSGAFFFFMMKIKCLHMPASIRDHFVVASSITEKPIYSVGASTFLKARK